VQQSGRAGVFLATPEKGCVFVVAGVEEIEEDMEG